MATESLLKQVGFVDLYLGHDYSDIKGMLWESSRLAPAPACLANDIASLKAVCLKYYQAENKNEFSLIFDDRLYRVTVTTDTYKQVAFVIRQTPDRIRAINEVGLTSELMMLISEEKKNGLILVSGAMGTGKTTTAAAIVSDKIKKSGLLGVAIEDPIETLLGGLHGMGRCIQLEVSEHENYSQALKRSMRMGANILFIGEIRDPITANEALKASLNGAFVVATLHAGSVIDAIERYSMLCNEMNRSANPIIAKSLFVVTHQRLKEVNRDGKFVAHHVSLDGYHIQSVATIKAKIKDGNFGSLIDDFSSIDQRRLRQPAR